MAARRCCCVEACGGGGHSALWNYSSEHPSAAAAASLPAAAAANRCDCHSLCTSCSHWFQMYSTLAMGATTHKVRSRCSVPDDRGQLAALHRCVALLHALASSLLQMLLSLPLRPHHPPAAGHAQPQPDCAGLLLIPHVHGLLLHLLRGGTGRGSEEWRYWATCNRSTCRRRVVCKRRLPSWLVQHAVLWADSSLHNFPLLLPGAVPRALPAELAAVAGAGSGAARRAGRPAACARCGRGWFFCALLCSLAGCSAGLLSGPAEASRRAFHVAAAAALTPQASSCLLRCPPSPWWRLQRFPALQSSSW